MRNDEWRTYATIYLNWNHLHVLNDSKMIALFLSAGKLFLKSREARILEFANFYFSAFLLISSNKYENFRISENVSWNCDRKYFTLTKKFEIKTWITYIMVIGKSIWFFRFISNHTFKLKYEKMKKELSIIF